MEQITMGGTVRSVNGIEADEKGDVKVKSGSVNSVNGVLPDEAGNVAIPNAEAVGCITLCLSNNIPAGYLPLTGLTYSRTVYADLWTYIQQSGILKTEEEWQALNLAQNGNVPYYSDGDGSTTFRVPAIKGWVKGDSTAGNYLSAGLPNIQGTIYMGEMINISASNAFKVIAAPWTPKSYRNQGEGSNPTVEFLASRCNPIYGNSDTVQPESVTVIYIVKALGAVNNVGEIEVSELIDIVQQAEEVLTNSSKRTYDTGWFDANNNSSYLFDTGISDGNVKMFFARLNTDTQEMIFDVRSNQYGDANQYNGAYVNLKGGKMVVTTGTSTVLHGIHAWNYKSDKVEIISNCKNCYLRVIVEEL